MEKDLPKQQESWRIFLSIEKGCVTTCFLVHWGNYRLMRVVRSMLVVGKVARVRLLLLSAVLVVLFVPLLLTSAGGQPPPSLGYVWSPPESGTPVLRYVIQVRKNGTIAASLADQTSDSIPAYALAVTYGDEYEIRVAGVDAEGRVGPFSGWSAEVSVEAPPPAPPPH